MKTSWTLVNILWGGVIVALVVGLILDARTSPEQRKKDAQRRKESWKKHREKEKEGFREKRKEQDFIKKFKDWSIVGVLWLVLIFVLIVCFG